MEADDIEDKNDKAATAQRLGIEALKRIQARRNHVRPWSTALLPGETEEDKEIEKEVQ